MGCPWSGPNSTWSVGPKTNSLRGHIGLRPNGHWASPIYLISRVSNCLIGGKLEIEEIVKLSLAILVSRSDPMVHRG